MLRSLPPDLTSRLEQKLIRFRLTVVPRLRWAVESCKQWVKTYTPLTMVSGVVLLLFGAYLFFYRAPDTFPIGSVVTIEPGMTLRQAADELDRADAIRSPLVFQAMVRALSGEGGVIAGDYFFSRPFSVFDVARKIVRGEHGLQPIRVSVSEGASVPEIAELFERKFGRFDAEMFIRLAQDKEGYLFPDTYFFLPNVQAPEVVRAMEENFHTKIVEIQDTLAASKRPLHDVVIMASLLEKEASSLSMRRRVAGVLWNRLSINMPLQVDAVFLYINGKSTYDLTHADLATTSPYNTYKNKGLPPGPIANPSLESLLAAADPIPSDYLFYLSDRYGNMYYAETFDEHIVNKRRYVY